MTFLEGKVPLALWEHGIRRVTVSHLRSEDRIVTTKLAEQLATADLDDGGTAIGLRYGSKHGNDWICWAIWIRDGLDRMTAVDDGAAVEPPERNPVLAKVLETYNLSAGWSSRSDD